jgi:hypothetical protein
MTCCLDDVVLPPAALSSLSGRRQDKVAQYVQSAVIAVEPVGRAIERRREARHPYPYPIHLTPLTADGTANVNETFVVIGKHLAPHGVDFYSPHPLAHRRVIASLDCGREGWIGLVAELAWCRFSRHGWYINGGRFIGVVPSPLTDLEIKPRVA